MTRVGLLTARGSDYGGGVATAVQSLALGLRATGRITPIVFTLQDDHIKQDREKYGDVEVVVTPQYGPTSFGYSPKLYDAIVSCQIDVLHLHGIWMHTSVVGLRWARATGRPYVISPHGMLNSWIRSRGRIKKFPAETFYERPGHRHATLVHALTENEKTEVLDFVPSASVSVIPNGVALVPEILGIEQRNPNNPYILYLGRLHEKKNLLALVEAWSRISAVERDWRLVIAGYGESEYLDKLCKHIEATETTGRVEFIGAVFGAQKADVISRARYIALPSRSEGLPLTILEAWAAGTPSIMTDFCNLGQGFRDGAAIRIGTEPEEIVPGLVRAIRESRWMDRSRAAVVLVNREFSEKAIINRWLKTYQSL